MFSLLKKISYAFLSNVVCCIVSVLVTFFIPKSLGVENYGLFHLYLFYINYTGFLHFGWADGVYLRYGGAYYEKLNKGLLAAQFRVFCLMEMMFSFLFCAGTLFLCTNHAKEKVFLLIGLSIALALPKTFLQYILQATNRIKEYSFLIMIERVIYGFVALTIVAAGKDSYVLVIAADLLGKFCALVYAVYHCRDIIFVRACSAKNALVDIIANVSVGIKLMLANVASLLILGIVRWSIERQWDVSVFGKISLTLSISNLMMIFIRSVSMVLLPTLRRTESSKYASIYSNLKTGLLIAMFGGLLLYYPLNAFLLYWLPDYSDCLVYMAILFPLCLYEGKLSLLVETYLKTMRMEKMLLLTNLATLLLSAVLTIVFVFILEDLTLIVLGILLIFAFRTFLGEFLLSYKISMHFVREGILEILLVAIFVSTAWFMGREIGFGIYAVFYILYVLFNKRNIADLVKIFKSNVESKK